MTNADGLIFLNLFWFFVFISKYEEPFGGERELELDSEPSEIIDQQSNKPLQSNAQESLEASLLDVSKTSLTKHIEEIAFSIL